MGPGYGGQQRGCSLAFSLLFKILLWLPQQTLTTPAYSPVHRPGRVYLKQAPGEFTKGCLKMAWAGWEAGTCPTWDEGGAVWAELVADG